MSLLDLDYTNLVNRDHPLNQGLLTWHMNLPKIRMGKNSPDHIRVFKGNKSGFEPPSSVWPPRYGATASWPFDGAAEINLGNKEPLKLLNTAFTLSCWVYWPSANANNNVGLMSKYGITNARAWNLATANTSTFTQGSVTFFYQSVAGTLNAAERLNTGSFLIDDDKWHHVVATFVPSTHAAIYIDGIERASTTEDVPASVADHSANCYLGRYAANEFNGYMDDCRIYTRALSLGEVIEYYTLSRIGYPDLFNRLNLSGEPKNGGGVTGVGRGNLTLVLKYILPSFQGA